jgi:hypothetical protein
MSATSCSLIISGRLAREGYATMRTIHGGIMGPLGTQPIQGSYEVDLGYPVRVLIIQRRRNLEQPHSDNGWNVEAVECSPGELYRRATLTVAS